MYWKTLLAILAILFINFSAVANKQKLSPTDLYAALPEVSLMAMSPDGSRIAYRQKNRGNDIIILRLLSSGKVLLAQPIDNINPVSIFFVDNERIILRSKMNQHRRGYLGRHDTGAMHLLNTKSRRVFQLMTPGYGISAGQIDTGIMLGISDDRQQAFMVGFDDNGYKNLYRVSLKAKRKPKLMKMGHSTALDFFVYNEQVVAIEYYDNETDLHTVEAKIDGKWKVVFERKAPIRTATFSGITADGKALVMSQYSRATDHRGYYKLSLNDGSVSEAIFDQEHRDIDSLIKDKNRRVYGVRYTGFKPDYKFFDKKLETILRNLTSSMPNNTLILVDHTTDWEQLIFYVEGDNSSGQYLIYKKGKIELLTNARPAITSDRINSVRTYSFKARDGLDIPSLITLPVGKELKNLPAVMLPHGGPASHDTIGFDWLAQYFASLGVVVLQPQFRGSDGFGLAHRTAGFGEWGEKMQDDLTDAVKDMVKQQIIDPERVCIVGASYGGYAALAGAALTPDIYHCAISVNGVSDLPRMLNSDKRAYGGDHWVMSYWNAAVKKGNKTETHLKQISPVYRADEIKIPVLLLHGEHDMVVPVEQSEVMYSALKAKDKNVRYVELDGGSHSLRNMQNRQQALKEIDRFVRQHLLDNKTVN